ncbi:hypothetical protein D3C71_1822290 [compost metagenome]
MKTPSTLRQPLPTSMIFRDTSTNPPIVEPVVVIVARLKPMVMLLAVDAPRAYRYPLDEPAAFA